MKTVTFARRLSELREQAGLTTYALAKKCGLTKQALYRLEQGVSEPTWQTVQLLAVALGVSCEDFTDPTLQPPAGGPAKPRGRPKKSDTSTEPPPKKDADLAKPPVKKTRKRKGE